MAQSEDTELRDLVVEALEKNGSLAEIRALLRANIFLAFEDDYKSIRQNATLDTVLKVPEGILALSIVNEFLEFCNLKNTLFVYKSETRQEREYKCESQKKLCEKLNIKQDGVREPVLVSIVKYIVRSRPNHYNERNNKPGMTKNDNLNYRDDQNCTYIVHDDSSSTTASQSHSDNSSDEKTKLHLRLQLDSDTDTSSDSARDKSSSEYIPNAHILHANDRHDISKHNTANVLRENEKNLILHSKSDNTSPYFLNELKILHNSSSDSTSYAELKPFNASDEKLLNTTGIPVSPENNYRNLTSQQPPSKDNKSEHYENGSEFKSGSVPNNLDNSSSMSHKKDIQDSKDQLNDSKPQELSTKSESETAEYSYDFSLSGGSKHNDVNSDNPSPKSVKEDINDGNLNRSIESPHNSHSSRSSVSISDVADLISEKSSISAINNDISLNKSKMSNQQLNISPRNVKSPSNDSGDFSESPVPSLSNLSLDLHSD